jgi:hypothetical protein
MNNFNRSHSYSVLLLLQLALGGALTQCMEHPKPPGAGGNFIFPPEGQDWTAYYLYQGQQFYIAAQPLTPSILTHYESGAVTITDPSKNLQFYYSPKTGFLYAILDPKKFGTRMTIAGQHFEYNPTTDQWEQRGGPVGQQLPDLEGELTQAITRRDEKGVKNALKKGATLEVTIAHVPALLYAARQWRMTNATEDKDILEILMGYAGTLSDPTLENVLSELVTAEYEDVLKFIISHNDKIAKRINARDTRQRTVLMRAAARGSEDIVAFLVKNGADVNAQDITGKTVLDYAEEAHKNHPSSKRKAVVDFLETKGATGKKSGILGWIGGGLGFGS